MNDEVMKTLDFKLYHCGVYRRDLPYHEDYLSYPYGYISQSRGAAREVRFAGQGPMYLKSGSAIIVPPAVRHCTEVPKTYSQSEAVFHWAHFQFFLMETLDVFSLFELPQVLYGRDADRLGDLIEAMADCRGNSVLTPLEVAATVKKNGFEMLELLLKTVPLKVQNPLSDHTRLQKITPALEYIRQNLAAKVTVAELARISRMSLTRFHVAFKDVMGISPVDYMIRERLRESQRLLWTTDLPIDEIALRCGYEDRFFFSRAFRQKLGVTPAECRRRFLKLDI